jgi:hypothetical protein
MGGMNFRNAYEFDPETDDGEGGGLPGMMRRYIEQQRLQQQGVERTLISEQTNVFD